MRRCGLSGTVREGGGDDGTGNDGGGNCVQSKGIFTTAMVTLMSGREIVNIGRD